MSKKSAMLISCSMMVVILITIVALSLAWYIDPRMGHPVVKAEGMSIMTEIADTVNVSTDEDDYPSYMGQTGKTLDLTNEDYAYRAVKQFSITLAPKYSSLMSVTGRLSMASVTMYNGTKQSSSTDSTMLNNFSWLLQKVDITEVPGGEDEETITNYYPSQYFGLTDNLIRTSDGDTLNVPLRGATYTFRLVIVFQDRDSFLNYLVSTGALTTDDPVPEMRDFAYCDYAYMNSKFEFDFDVGMAQRSISRP